MKSDQNKSNKFDDFFFKYTDILNSVLWKKRFTYTMYWTPVMLCGNVWANKSFVTF